MREFIIKAKIKEVAAGRNDNISKHIFAVDEVAARNKFRLIYDDPDNLDWQEIELQSIEEVK